MNLPRIALAAVAATIVDALYGFCVYGNLLSSQFAAYPGVYRQMETQGAYMPILFAGVFLAMIAASVIYAKGYEGGSGVAEGGRFGALVGLLAVGYTAVIGYAVMNIGRRIAASMAVAAFVEWIVAGIVIGLVYKPASKR
jgi:hypothetical protein